MKLIVFLGNPGREYSDTRHNAGWMIADKLTELFQTEWQEKFSGDFGNTMLKGEKTLLLKPKTYMNKSGTSVQKAAAYFKLAADDCIIVHDDLELPFGRIDLKKGGGLAGHNGLRSIAQFLNTVEFYRLRFGIGRPSRGSVSTWVLSRFTMEEEAELPDLLEKAVRILTENR